MKETADIDTEISQMLGWWRFVVREGQWCSPQGRRGPNNFTSDKKLTSQELDRKGWVWKLGSNSGGSAVSILYNGATYRYEYPGSGSKCLAVAFWSVLRISAGRGSLLVEEPA